MPATANLVARYLADHGNTLAPASLARRVATLSKVHSANDWPSSCHGTVVSLTLRGVKRAKGTAQDWAGPLLCEYLFLI